MRESFLQDLRFGVRLLRRQPAFSAAIILSLALGVGSATAVITLLDAVLWRPIQVEEPDRLVSFYGTLRTPSGEYVGTRSFSYEGFADIRGRNTFLSSTALWQWQPLYRTGLAQSEKLIGTFVSWGYFGTLGLRPSLGRLLQPEDADTLRDDRLVVLSYGYWRSSFGGDPSVLGRRLTLNSQDFEIVGVAPRGFRGLDLQTSSDVFIPVSLYPQIGTYAHLFADRATALFRISGRLAPGVSVEQADRGIHALMREVVADLPRDFEKLGARAIPLQEASIRPVDRLRYVGYGRTLLLTSGLLLLVACCNVANLLLLRGLERARALSIRKVLGADRWRLVRQLATEHSLLFAAGGALGLLVTQGALVLFWRFRPVQFGAGAFEPGLNVAAVVFTGIAVLFVGSTFGLFPAFRASRLSAMEGLRSRPLVGVLMKKRFSWRSALVAAQVALAFAALAGGSLLLRSLTNARGQDLGFDADPLYLLRIAPGQQDYRKPRALELYRKIREEVIAIPGVEAAAWSENRLLRGAVLQRQIYVGPADEAVRMGDRDFHRTNIVGPTFLETVGLSLLRGRDFAPRDTEGGRKVAIVNSTMAQGLWHGEDPVGRSFHFGSLTGPELEVIGVVEDARYREMLEDPQYFVYLPLSQNYASAMTLHVRASGDPLEIAGPVNARVRWLAPELATTETQTMRRFVDEALWSERTSALFLTIFAILSSLMAALGIYATVAYTTARRAPEFGVRAALGASASQLAWPTFLEGARVITGGLFVGWLLAYLWIAPLLTTQLHEVGSLDPAVLAWLFLSFASVGLTSSWISSKRIANRDTAEVLRTDF